MIRFLWRYTRQYGAPAPFSGCREIQREARSISASIRRAYGQDLCFQKRLAWCRPEIYIITVSTLTCGTLAQYSCVQSCWIFDLIINDACTSLGLIVLLTCGMIYRMTLFLQSLSILLSADWASWTTLFSYITHTALLLIIFCMCFVYLCTYVYFVLIMCPLLYCRLISYMDFSIL